MIEQFVTRWAILGTGVVSRKFVLGLRPLGAAARVSAVASRDPWTFQTYVRESFGEFSVAKQGYVATRGGWFSERSLGYLASGRPVITEDTAFSSWLPTGDGLLAYCDIDQAAAAIADVAAHPQRHARAARAIAIEHFDHRVVLADLLQLAGTASALHPIHI